MYLIFSFTHSQSRKKNFDRHNNNKKKRLNIDITFNANQMVTEKKEATPKNYFARINANRFLSVSHAHYQSVAVRYKVR